MIFLCLTYKVTHITDLETDVAIGIYEIVTISFYDQDLFEILN